MTPVLEDEELIDDYEENEPLTDTIVTIEREIETETLKEEEKINDDLDEWIEERKELERFDRMKRIIAGIVTIGAIFTIGVLVLEKATKGYW